MIKPGLSRADTDADTKADIVSADVFTMQRGIYSHSGDGTERVTDNTCSTGFAELDALLPDAGWPPASLIELHIAREGIGELRLLMPFLARLSGQQQPAWTAWIAPPYIPYAPALSNAGIDLRRQLLIRSGLKKDTLWALEQTLTSGACSAVLAWPEKLAYSHLRRLQLAARNGRCHGFLFYAGTAAGTASPAALRLQLSGREDQLSINILKCRGSAFPYRLNIAVDPEHKHVMA